ncbi:MAG: SGNH/GDSL hydrolase family protein [Xenococcus sp. MO_188.B8]|nr:SGNH/GDSL hydrolase family protein [Xenococcus sp. MO_188.B8]
MDELFKIDFDAGDLAAGTIITDQFEGISISSSSDFGAMLFDTNNITGEDFDLSATDWGNVLIISEDGDSSDPDDNAVGGTISIKFDQLASINSVGLLDIDEEGSLITLFDDDSNILEVIEIENRGDNSFQEIAFNVTDVSRMEIHLAGSGAVTGLDFRLPKKVPTFSKIYVFGDSLSDPGNIFNYTTSLQSFEELFGLDIPVIPPSPPYFEGRFSNGPVWVDNLVADLELTIAPSTELSRLSPEIPLPSAVTLTSSGLEVSPFFNGATTTNSVNFAFGGAQTGQNGAGELGEFIPGVQRQVEWFVNDHQQAGQLATADALYIIWGGPNDYQTVPDADPEGVVDNLETSIESLFNLGARNFLVPNLPDLGKTPIAQTPNRPVSPTQLTDLTEQHNSLLEETLDELSGTLNGINLMPLDVNDLFNDILADPEDFGFTNISDPCLNSDPISLAVSLADPDSSNPEICAQPEEYLFWDLLHPTASAHEILGKFALETLATQGEYVFS